MKILDTPLAGVKIAQSVPHRDARGAFTRLFCAEELQPVLGQRQIVQINHSRTSSVGAVRGMHFQHPPHAEMKMIRCLRGRVVDVAVDLRAGSATFLQWHAVELTQDDAQMLVIPEGFAHGFQVLEPHSELLYLHTAFYNPASEGGLRHDDPRLAITWPLPPQDLSPRDLSHPLLSADFTGVAL
ncbi:dTDP-4-dehydrorhamnose 3,5-epimerase [Mycobacterium intracellulare MOTT-02]|uniref:dTDP-4-dehydrorhamnose 3,5-epimerase n=2 Tax=Mycobacteriaceae TaxID=1762 RepID=H8IS75_MYCIA|nr:MULTISPECIES: dTDP-4-dehydrorhamnose 3,5-epimerase family protein [Mycobacterium avium complex (MAC)]AFC44313.1 dTDP-4-dehydrorhamnose 3,5-epimerase [Mycobacterium intracellulare ATCC 13950]AFC49469.1 dTDP-4-dehydrorhamnose 3,5-epimerase [Mycobacterium intracellulare MOTT-02]KEF95510.1 dTDP-4-dehydrorhamnose 3,5-epimerase [Mycobacterium sp. TKK-01-0059]BCP37833.1 dTDP-4-dehydrorhamnose 3,5-epimerase [Mycobacterium intracellulare M.i.198]OBG04431.1 dTDP-4-dehydrorhamnose 3,5-epimerase [Mycob